MLNQMLTAIGAVVGLMLGLLAVLALKRRSDPGGKDVLSCGSCGAHSCGGCALDHAATAPRRGVQ
jgi:hypothetical protein